MVKTDRRNLRGGALRRPHFKAGLRRLAWLILLLTAACSPAGASTLGPEVTVPVTESLATVEPVAASATPAATLAAAEAPAVTPTQAVAEPTAAPMPSPTATLAPAAAPCVVGVCTYSGVLPFQRPVALPARDTVDPTYRFGSTQGGQRDPHHGVEFLNPIGTPVLAAADGVVVVSGDDRETFYGPYSYFYGNLVVIEHTFTPEELRRWPELAGPVYTLYGHLSEIAVPLGARVRLGQEIGKVGMSGVATGNHLHFEVRVGANEYAASRNPELWLAPHAAEDGTPHGALAGRVLDAQGSILPVENVVLQHLSAENGPPDAEFYTTSYEEKALIGQGPWQESFGLGDLPPGWYQVSFAQNGFQRHRVQVLPGQVTVLAVQVRE